MAAAKVGTGWEVTLLLAMSTKNSNFGVAALRVLFQEYYTYPKMVLISLLLILKMCKVMSLSWLCSRFVQGSVCFISFVIFSFSL